MLRKFARNAGHVLTNPAMTAAYAHWSWDRLMGQATQVKLPGGGSVSGFSSFGSYWSFQPVQGREYRLLQRVTRDASILGDIGANLGAFTIAMARLAPQARVFSFEACPATLNHLIANVRMNGLNNVACLGHAVCDETGTVRFSNQNHRPANNSLVVAPILADAPTVEVPATTLDYFCDAQAIPFFDFLKIDAEGAEPRILRGGEQVFRSKRIKAALIEICHYWLKSAGSSANELVDQIRSLGYELFAIADDGRPGSRISESDLQQNELINALLLPA